MHFLNGNNRDRFSMQVFIFGGFLETTIQNEGMWSETRTRAKGSFITKSTNNFTRCDNFSVIKLC